MKDNPHMGPRGIVGVTRGRVAPDTLLVPLLSILLLICAWQKWLPIDLTEAWGFATGALCVWLVTKESLWNWPIGLVNNIFFAILFWKARLYADFGLQWVTYCCLLQAIRTPGRIR